MHSAKGRANTEHDNQPFDLAPTTVMQMVADIPAFDCPFRSLDAGRHTELVHQHLRVRYILRFDIQRQIHKMQDFRFTQVADGPGGIRPVCATRLQSVYAIFVKAFG